jgi:hypothetical protein
MRSSPTFLFIGLQRQMNEDIFQGGLTKGGGTDFSWEGIDDIANELVPARTFEA